MKLTHLPSEFQEALPILEKLQEAGYEAYFVGGSVRDAILERPIHDVDIATSAYPEETKAVFPRTVDIGIEHGTVLVLHEQGEYEITTFRTEDVYVDFRRPSQVSFVRSLEEDLKRRDFTVNAFALDNQAQVIDKFNGLADLQNKTLRAVGVARERFNEDALRIMRGFRFAASLGFTIENETFKAMTELAPLLKKISVERIFIESDKLLLAKGWRKGLEDLISSGAYDYLPGLSGKKAELYAFLETVNPDFQFQTSEQAWAALLLFLNVSDTNAFCKKWKTSRDFQKMVDRIVSAYQKRLTGQPDEWFVYQYGLACLLLVEELRAAAGLQTEVAAIQKIHMQLQIHDRHEICVNGGILMQEFNAKPGPHLGTILNQIEKAIVTNQLENRPHAIFSFIKEKNLL
ncbi:CCA tRNA nucleotidyltransferase [Streptococcus cameli]